MTGIGGEPVAPAEREFCRSVPTLLRQWSANSLRTYMTCPRKYYYEYVEGWRRPQNEDTEFGEKYHAALEEFDRAVARGESKADATDAALRWALYVSFREERDPEVQAYIDASQPVNPPPGKPVFWGGAYLTVWRCSDEGPALKSGPRRGQPNAAKRCLNAKQDHYGDPPSDVCSECGKPLVVEEPWVPVNKAKNRHTLIRAVIQYCDEQPEEGGVRPLVFPDGSPAVELAFVVPLPYLTPDGEPYLLAGRLDGIARFADETATRERKTTKNTLNKMYFDRYAPDVQVDSYDLVSWLLYPNLKPVGVMMEATQTAAEFTRIQREFVTIPNGRREEWFGEIGYWLKRAEADARAGVWPKNTASCSANGGCPFRVICRLEPAARHRFLPSHFEKRAGAEGLTDAGAVTI